MGCFKLSLVIWIITIFSGVIFIKKAEAQEDSAIRYNLLPPSDFLSIAELGNYSLQTPLWMELRGRRGEEYRRNRYWGIGLAAGGGALLLGSIISFCFSEECAQACAYGSCTGEVCGTNGTAVAFGVILLAGAIAAGIFSYLKFRAASRIQAGRRQRRRSLLDISIAQADETFELDLLPII